MPAKSQWLLRIPEICSELAQLDVPVVDRALIERLVDLKRRRAIGVLHQFGGYQAGKTFLIDRMRLIERLEALQSGVEFEQEQQRKARLEESLDQVRRQNAAAQVTIMVPRDVWNRQIAGLSEQIQIAPGRLQIEFCKTEDLLQKLFELAQAITNDFERFETLADGS